MQIKIRMVLTQANLFKIRIPKTIGKQVPFPVTM